jgi:hypothetical protein
VRPRQTRYSSSGSSSATTGLHLDGLAREQGSQPDCHSRTVKTEPGNELHISISAQALGSVSPTSALFDQQLHPNKFHAKVQLSLADHGGRATASKVHWGSEHPQAHPGENSATSVANGLHKPTMPDILPSHSPWSASSGHAVTAFEPSSMLSSLRLASPVTSDSPWISVTDEPTATSHEDTPDSTQANLLPSPSAAVAGMSHTGSHGQAPPHLRARIAALVEAQRKQMATLCHGNQASMSSELWRSLLFDPTPAPLAGSALESLSSPAHQPHTEHLHSDDTDTDTDTTSLPAEPIEHLLPAPASPLLSLPPPWL